MMQKICRQHNKGFAALVAVIMVSTALLLAVLSTSDSVAVISDEANHKKYRIEATQNALACLQVAYEELGRDYFYNIMEPVGPEAGCKIISVTGNTNNINNPGATRTVITSGQAGGGFFTTSVTAYVTAQVLLNDQKISLLSSKVTF